MFVLCSASQLLAQWQNRWGRSWLRKHRTIDLDYNKDAFSAFWMEMCFFFRFFFFLFWNKGSSCLIIYPFLANKLCGFKSSSASLRNLCGLCQSGKEVFSIVWVSIKFQNPNHEFCSDWQRIGWLWAQVFWGLKLQEKERGKDCCSKQGIYSC